MNRSYLAVLLQRCVLASILSIAFLLAACSGSSSSGGVTNVTFTYTTFSGAPKDLQAVQNAINASPALVAKHIKLTLEPIDFAAYDQKLKLRYAAGTPCDLVFTANWANDFSANVAQGNFLDISSLASANAPQTLANLPNGTLDAGRVDGKLYAIPNQQLFPTYWGAIIRKDLATKYHLDVTTLHTYADLAPFLAEIKANEPGVTPLYSDDQLGGVVYHNEAHGVDGVLTPDIGVNVTDSSLHAFELQATPEYLADAQLARQWYQDGYYLKDPLSASDAQAAFKSGKFAVLLDQARPDEPQKFKAAYGYDEVQALFTQPFLNTTSITATMTSVCRSSTHPAQALQALEILNTDKTVYNLITHGIAGKDYTTVDQSSGLINVPADSGYNPNTDWMFGNQFNALYADANAAQQNLWQQESQLNKTATASVALGFSFDSSSVKTQLAQVAAVDTQYNNEISKGLVDPTTTLPQYLSSLKAAGIDAIVAEVQKQLTAWKAAQGK